MTRGIATSAVVGFFVVAAFFAHELSHALVATYYGPGLVELNVLSVTWYPTIAWKPEYGYGGFVQFMYPANLTAFYIILLSGSMGNLLISVLSISLVTLTPVRGLARAALLTMSLYFLDNLIHILPVVGIRPLGWSIYFFRSFAEAYFAAEGMGVPDNLFLAFVFASSSLILVLWLRALRRSFHSSP